MKSAKAKRLALIVPAFPKTSETFIVSKFLGLLERGWDVHVVCHKSDPEGWAKFPDMAADAGVSKRVHRSLPTSPKFTAGLLLIPALIRGLVCTPGSAWRYLVRGFGKFGWNVFKKYYLDLELILLKPDLIHFEFGSLAVGKTYLKEFLDCQLTVSFRGYDLNFAGLEQPDYYAQVWQHVDACHFLGKDLWRRALRRGCPQEMPHRLIPPSVDLERFRCEDRDKSEADGTPEKPIRILSVGRLEWIKGYEFAFQAVKMLVDQGIACEYQIIGDGEHREALYFARHQLDLKVTIEFSGSLPQDQVIRHLAEADIFLHSAVSEGFCNAVLEAQAMKLPIVCTDAGGLSENVADGVTGFVVPRRNPRAIAGKLLVLTRDSSLRYSMGRAGRERVETHFQIDQQLDAWENFYKTLK